MPDKLQHDPEATASFDPIDDVPTAGLDLSDSGESPQSLGPGDLPAARRAPAAHPIVDGDGASGQDAKTSVWIGPADSGRSAISLPAREITNGTLLRGRYLVEHLVGMGGNSLVFQATDRHRESVEEAGGKIAVKSLRPQLRDNPYALMRMRREFRQMQLLTHDGIARVFDLDCDDGLWFMTMELVAGQTIAQWMKGPTTDAQAMQIITACCEAVSYAHSRSIVHGDLKPSNVLITTNGIKLVDFGSAAAETGGSAVAVSARSFAATPAYASPQILTGNLAEPRDDVFSLACLAYAVLTRGEHPFERKSSLDAYREQMRPAYSSKLQPRVFDVIVNALAWQRPNRPASVAEFLSALIGNDFGYESRSTALVTASASRAHDAKAARLEVTQFSLAQDAIQSVPVTLDIPQSQRYGFPVQWLAFQPWAGSISWSARGPSEITVTAKSDDSFHDGPWLKWNNPTVTLASAPLVQMARPEPATIEGEILTRTLITRPAAAITPRASHPTIWHRHGLAALAVIGVLAILLSHESDVGSSTAPAQTALPQFPAPPAAAQLAATMPAIREITDASPIATEPRIVEHVVPPPPAAPGFVSFESATVQVGSNQSMAVLTVKRLDSTQGRARIAWTVEGGSAQAVVDSDAIDSQTIQFLDGQEIRSLYIPLKAPTDPGSHQPTRSFTVKLQKLEGSPAIGPVTQSKVMIASGY